MSSPNNIKIMVLSHQSLYIDALKSLLSTENKDFTVEGLTTSENSVTETIKSFDPEVILLDANGMGKNIWDFLNLTHKQNPKVKIIMLANSNEQIYLEYAHKNGASGYILKSSPKELLVAAIRIVMKEGSFYDPGIKAYNKNGVHHKIQEKYNLSARELEIILLIKDGLSSKDMASSLGISFHTIEAHRKNIYNKLQINKVTELLKIFAEFGD
ncbi:LuxR C-terminal-related transcriptional regulator [Lacihabitans soyangensis]|uniref:DNA-binding response regulator n=1 Tax=Lacihabitans soyangensis TaxID=869394 RepID=A0AAE3H0X2_9BACT|nr:response regulator transcription factor [Lacihabitans soyangensis]MCP9762260.1 DNA-binding response regulator [Lacihabitans soyangensis]